MKFLLAVNDKITYMPYDWLLKIVIKLSLDI